MSGDLWFDPHFNAQTKKFVQVLSLEGQIWLLNRGPVSRKTYPALSVELCCVGDMCLVQQNKCFEKGSALPPHRGWLGREVVPEPAVHCALFHGDLVPVTPGGPLGVQWASDEWPRFTARYIKAFIVLPVMPAAFFLI